MRQLLQLVFLLPLLFCTSCGVMFGGMRDNVTFTSVPPGAEVFAGSDRIGITPCSGLLPRNASTVVFKSAGLGERSVKVQSTTRWWALFMDILFTPGFGASGVITDLATGGMWDPPDTIVCDFATAPKTESKPKAKANADPDWGPGI